MKLQPTSKGNKALSQGRPKTIDGRYFLSAGIFHGWKFVLGVTKLWLGNRSMRHVAKSLSAQPFLVLSLLLFFTAMESPRASNSVEQVANDFESLMLDRMYQQMENSNQALGANDENNPFAPSQAELYYRSMLNSEVMKGLAKQRPLGVANLIEKQMRGEIGIGSGAQDHVKSNGNQEKESHHGR